MSKTETFKTWKASDYFILARTEQEAQTLWKSWKGEQEIPMKRLRRVKAESDSPAIYESLDQEPIYSAQSRTA